MVEAEDTLINVYFLPTPARSLRVLLHRISLFPKLYVRLYAVRYSIQYSDIYLVPANPYRYRFGFVYHQSRNSEPGFRVIPGGIPEGRTYASISTFNGFVIDFSNKRGSVNGYVPSNTNLPRFFDILFCKYLKILYTACK